MSDHDIDATNVLPAFEASLSHGATEAEIRERVGWRRAELVARDARVSGQSTYQHMELMYTKPDYAGFVLAAVAGHTPSSLGVVGLACKTSATVGEAMACHGRFQALTNRSARYETSVDANTVTLTEQRHGPEQLGRRLISDYTLLVAIALLRNIAGAAPPVLALRSVRGELGEAERRAYERYAGAPVESGAAHAQLVMCRSLLSTPVVSADAELAAYFRTVLERAAPLDADEPALIRRVRAAIRDGMIHGTPSVATIARALGLGPRTLQRRLAHHDLRFATVLESTRRALAECYLDDPSLSLSEIAYLLGYAEHASFFRAFRRWYGTTPAEHRRTARIQ